MKGVLLINVLFLFVFSAYNHRYITDYVCTNSVHDDAKESRVSFPSGHSSFSAFTMLYVAIFIQMKWRVNKSALRLLKSGIQLAVMLLAYYTALSRVMDNKVNHQISRFSYPNSFPFHSI